MDNKLLPGEVDRTGFWKARTRPREGGPGFVMVVSQDTPFYFDTDQAAAMMLWMRLYALSGRQSTLPLSVLTDVLGYPERTGRRLLSELVEIGLVRKVTGGSGNRSFSIKVLGHPSTKKSSAFYRKPHAVWKAYQRMISGDQDDLEGDTLVNDSTYLNRPNMAAQPAKFGRSIYEKEKYENIKDSPDTWSAEDLMINRVDEVSGMDAVFIITRTLFPDVPEAVSNRVSEIIESRRGTMGAAIDLIRASKFADAGLVASGPIRDPDDADAALLELIREARDQARLHCDALRVRLARATHDEVPGLGTRSMDLAVEGDRKAVEAWVGLSGNKYHEDDLKLCRVPPGLIAARLWVLDQTKAEDYLSSHEDLIKQDLVESMATRRFVSGIPEYLEHLGMDSETLDAMAEDYADELRAQIADVTTLKWSPKLIQTDEH